MKLILRSRVSFSRCFDLATLPFNAGITRHSHRSNILGIPGWRKQRPGYEFHAFGDGGVVIATDADGFALIMVANLHCTFDHFQMCRGGVHSEEEFRSDHFRFRLWRANEHGMTRWL